jgi:hypothetical protein
MQFDIRKEKMLSRAAHMLKPEVQVRMHEFVHLCNLLMLIALSLFLLPYIHMHTVRTLGS